MKIRGNPALHVVDRYVGKPLLIAIGSLKRKKGLPKEINRVGLLKGSAIGDTVLLSGVIADLRAGFPKAKLILFAGETNFDVACLVDGLDKVVKVPHGNVLKALKAVRSEPVDVMLDFASWSHLEALIAIVSNSKFTVGFRTPGQQRHYGYDAVVQHSGERHEIDNYRWLVKLLGVETKHLPVLRIPKDAGRDDSHALAQNREYVVCHLWPGGRRKDRKKWPAERWQQLIATFVRHGLRVLLTGGLEDQQSNVKMIEELPPQTKPYVESLAGETIRRTAEVLLGARLVVSVDTGIMHVASALGVPLVALHGPTSSKRWGPLSSSAVAVDTPLPEGGYISLGWEDAWPAPPCMEAISYDAVHGACLRLLNLSKLQQNQVQRKEPIELRTRQLGKEDPSRSVSGSFHKKPGESTC